jgi:hypothetical protein
VSKSQSEVAMKRYCPALPWTPISDTADMRLPAILIGARGVGTVPEPEITVLNTQPVCM